MVQNDLESFAKSAGGRRPLLHAIAIQEIGEHLSVGRAHATHVPGSIFAAATVYYAVVLAHLMDVKVPLDVIWDDAWADPLSSPEEIGLSSTVWDTQLFVLDRTPMGPQLEPRNLSFSLHTLLAILRAVSSQWGVCYEMIDIIQS